MRRTHQDSSVVSDGQYSSGTEVIAFTFGVDSSDRLQESHVN